MLRDNARASAEGDRSTESRESRRLLFLGDAGGLSGGSSSPELSTSIFCFLLGLAAAFNVVVRAGGFGFGFSHGSLRGMVYRMEAVTVVVIHGVWSWMLCAVFSSVLLYLGRYVCT